MRFLKELVGNIRAWLMPALVCPACKSELEFNGSSWYGHEGQICQKCGKTFVWVKIYEVD